MRRMYWLSVLMVLAWLGCAANSRADTIMFTDRDAWEAAVVALGYNLTNIDFENATTSADHTSVTVSNVVFTDDLSRTLNVTDSPTAYNSGKVLDFFMNQPVDVSLPTSVYAFGFDLGEIYVIRNQPPLTLNNVALSNGEVFAGPFQGNPYPNFSFFGFLSDAPISGLSMRPHSLVEPFLDNFTYAQQATPVPEPSSMLLLCSGLLGLASHSWKNRRRR